MLTQFLSRLLSIAFSFIWTCTYTMIVSLSGCRKVARLFNAVSDVTCGFRLHWIVELGCTSKHSVKPHSDSRHHFPENAPLLSRNNDKSIRHLIIGDIIWSLVYAFGDAYLRDGVSSHFQTGCWLYLNLSLMRMHTLTSILFEMVSFPSFLSVIRESGWPYLGIILMIVLLTQVE